MKKLSPVIVVDAVEPLLPFWRDRLGFEVTVSVPHDDTVGFVILQKGGVEVMYQSHASVEDDLPDLAGELAGQRPLLFIEVDDPALIDDLERDFDESDVAVPRRQTFYGMDEIFLRAPCGTVVGFAAPIEE